MTEASTTETLDDALNCHGRTLAADRVRLLGSYCELLWNWNRQLNLTRHTDFETFVTRDLLDSEKLAEHLQPGETVLDIGAGGGVPGVVLAILRPDLTLTLAESTVRKADALRSIVSELNLPVTVVSERGEKVLEDCHFSTVTARAVAPLKKLLPLLKKVRHSFGRLLLVKGPNWQNERNDAAAARLLTGLSVDVVAEYSTVGRDGNSVILQVRPTSRTGG